MVFSGLFLNIIIFCCYVKLLLMLFWDMFLWVFILFCIVVFLFVNIRSFFLVIGCLVKSDLFEDEVLKWFFINIFLLVIINLNVLLFIYCILKVVLIVVMVLLFVVIEKGWDVLWVILKCVFFFNKMILCVVDEKFMVIIEFVFRWSLELLVSVMFFCLLILVCIFCVIVVNLGVLFSYVCWIIILIVIVIIKNVVVMF